MGFQLWISPNTGIRRKGTTFRELQAIFIDSITTKLIYEPIYCCRIEDSGREVKKTLENRDFDIIGVINENENIFGFAVRDELGNKKVEHYTKRIELENITADSTPILELLNILSINPYAFVIQKNEIVGIVTRADINKPIVRIYIFGIISLFEMHLNFWINEFHKDDSWKDKIQETRFKEAEKIFNIRKGQNDDLTLLECAQLCDKRDVLNNTDEFRSLFKLSKKQFERLLKDSEKIRNELAHSQNSIIANLNWENFVNTISNVESFLNKSEEIVDSKARTKNKE
jgi:predicted transcriptional regulator